MFPAGNMMEWMVVSVLCLPVRGAVTIWQSSRVDSIDGFAGLRCVFKSDPKYPYPSPKILQATLLKGLNGREQLCSNLINVTAKSSTMQKRALGKVQCSSRLTEGAVEVTVSGLKTTDSDFYRCEIKILFPPPFLRFTGNGTFIHVYEKYFQKQAQRQSMPQRHEEDSDQKVPTVNAPVAILLILICAALLGIVYLQAVQCIQKRRNMV